MPGAMDGDREGAARVLFVADGRKGHVTRRARGTIYRDFFARDGWIAEFADAGEGARSLARRAPDFDLVYLLKVSSLPLVERLRRAGARLVFDFCEPLWNPARRKSGWKDLDRILGAVDAVFAENRFVADYAYARARNGRVLLVPDGAQAELFDAARAAVPRRGDGRVVLGWVGSTRTAIALETIREPLRRLAARRPELEVRVVGARPADAARHLEGVPHTVRPEYDEAGMIREMLALDVGLFPAPFDDEDYAARGALKAKLYMAAGIPCVCRRGGDCDAVIREGVTGFLAAAPEEWEEKLEILIRDPALRRRMGGAALEVARREYSLESSWQTLRAAFLEVLRLPPRPRPPAPRAGFSGLLARWRGVPTGAAA